MTNKEKINRKIIEFIDKALLVTYCIPLGLSIPAMFYTGVEINQSIKTQKEEIRRSIIMGNPLEKDELAESLEKKAKDIYFKTVHPLIGSCDIHISSRPFFETATYDPQMDMIFISMNSTPENIIHEVGHKSYKQLTSSEKKILSEMCEEYKRRILIKEKEKRNKGNNKQNNSEVYRFQGFSLNGENSINRLMKLDERKFDEEVYADLFEKYYSDNILTYSVSKKPTWIEGNEEFKSIFRPFFETKYPKTTETIRPREVRVVNGLEDLIYSFATNYVKILYDLGLGYTKKDK